MGEVVDDLGALLNAAGVPDLDALAGQINDHTHLPVVIPHMRHQDGLPHHLLVEVSGEPLWLIFPLQVREMWQRIDDVEAEIAAQDQASCIWSRLR